MRGIAHDHPQSPSLGHGLPCSDCVLLFCVRAVTQHKISQQEALTKTLRKKQKELKENSGALTNQKSTFASLQMLLETKMRSSNGIAEPITSAQAKVGGARGAGAGAKEGYGGNYPTAYAEPIMQGEVLSFDNKNAEEDDYY